MCLTKLVNYKSVPKYGYKCFERYLGEKKLRPECTWKNDVNGEIIYKKGIVYKTNKSNGGAKYIFTSGFKYKAGYHCFTTLKAIKDWADGDTNLVIYKVAIDKVVAQGVQDYKGRNHRVVVAQQFKLIKRMR